MSDIPKDWSTVRAEQRAIVVSTAMRYLGPEREQDAEELADCMMAHLDNIRAAAAGLLQPNAPHPDAERLVRELGEQMREHSAQLVETSFSALGVFLNQALAIATRRR
jgi:hypothetical protein